MFSQNNFETVNERVAIQEVAIALCGHPNTLGQYKYPNERTASIRIYPNQNTFFDYGRGIGGDCIGFVSHILGISNYDALQYLAEKYNIPVNTDKVSSLSGHDRSEAERKIRAFQRKKDREKQAFKETMEQIHENVKRIRELKEKYQAAVGILPKGYNMILDDFWDDDRMVQALKDKITLQGEIESLCDDTEMLWGRVKDMGMMSKVFAGTVYETMK